MSPALSEEFPVVGVAMIFQPKESALVKPAVRDVCVHIRTFLLLCFNLVHRLELQVQLTAAARRDLVLHHRGDDVIQDVGHAAAALHNLTASIKQEDSLSLSVIQYKIGTLRPSEFLLFLSVWASRPHRDGVFVNHKKTHSKVDTSEKASFAL